MKRKLKQFISFFLRLPNQINRMEQNMATKEQVQQGFARFDAAFQTETEEIKTAVSKVRSAVEEGNTEQAQQFLNELDQRTATLGSLSEQVMQEVQAPSGDTDPGFVGETGELPSDLAAGGSTPGGDTPTSEVQTEPVADGNTDATVTPLT